MNISLIYASIHHGNTEEIARVINSEMDGDLIDFTKAKKEDVMSSDLVGFGSGIYIGKFHKELLEFVKNLPTVENKKAFLFSTAGMSQRIPFNRGHKKIKKILKEKGFEIIGEFDCLGSDTYGPLKLIGGVNKGRPNKKDKRKAKEFAKNIKNKLNQGNEV